MLNLSGEQHLNIIIELIILLRSKSEQKMYNIHKHMYCCIFAPPIGGAKNKLNV